MSPVRFHFLRGGALRAPACPAGKQGKKGGLGRTEREKEKYELAEIKWRKPSKKTRPCGRLRTPQNAHLTSGLSANSSGQLSGSWSDRGDATFGIGRLRRGRLRWKKQRLETPPLLRAALSRAHQLDSSVVDIGRPPILAPDTRGRTGSWMWRRQGETAHGKVRIPSHRASETVVCASTTGGDSGNKLSGATQLASEPALANGETCLCF